MAMSGSGGGSGRMAGRRKRRRPSSEINVTPLVDVMLVLLIIFMVTAPMLSSGVNVDLPKTSANPVKMDSKPITVSLKDDGSLYLGDNAVQPEALVAELRKAADNDSTRRIFVRADARIDYGQVMKLMGQITSSGFSHVALLAQQPPTAQ